MDEEQPKELATRDAYTVDSSDLDTIRRQILTAACDYGSCSTRYPQQLSGFQLQVLREQAARKPDATND